jgi:WD40 repeat protein
MKGRQFILYLATFLLLELSLSHAVTGPFSVERKITASDAATDDQFGRSVAISGNNVIVGAWQVYASNGGKSGAAYVYDISKSREVLKLTASDAEVDDAFGHSVGVSGNRVIVGASLNDDDGTNSGSAYLFDLTTGMELFKLNASDAEENDQFGNAVAIGEDRAIVGAAWRDETGVDSGAAYVFDIATGAELYKLVGSDTSEYDQFGNKVAISGNLGIVSAHGHDGAATNAGAAYVFDLSTGTQVCKLTISDATADEYSGYSVAIDGDLAIVGSALKSATGAAYLFDARSGQQLMKLTASDVYFNQYFGSDVAISGNLAIVGALGDNREVGAAYVFDVRTGKELRKITASDLFNTYPREFNDRFGEFVAIDGNKAVIGVRLSDDHGTSSGSVYLFVPEPSPILFTAVGTGLLILSRYRKCDLYINATR